MNACIKLRGECSLATSFMISVKKCISERVCKLWAEGRNIYEGTRLLFKFNYRSGTHRLSLNALECTLCGAECV